jgi:hypothetical protein
MYKITMTEVDDMTGEEVVTWSAKADTEVWTILVDRIVEGLKGMGFVLSSQDIAEYLLNSHDIPYEILGKDHLSDLTEQW